MAEPDRSEAPNPLEPSEAMIAYRAAETKALMEKDRRYLQVMPYNPRVAALICARVAEGTLLKTVLDEYGMAWGTIRKWERRKREFREALAEAQRLAARFLAEEAVEISDEQVLTMPEVARMKERIAARKWLASKEDPDRYGDKVQVDATLDLGKILDRVYGAPGPGAPPIEVVPETPLAVADEAEGL